MNRRIFAVGVAVVAFAGCRLLWAPGLLGSPGAEVYGHAWVQGWAAEVWPRLPHETTTLDPRGPVPFAVIDPLITWVAAGLSRGVGSVVAWDVLVLAAVAGAYAGGCLVAREVDGDEITGGLVLALGPVFCGSLASGLSEDFAVGLLAAALVFVNRPGVRAAVLGGALLGLLSACGLYLALMGALGALVLGGFAVARDRGRLGGLVAGAGVAAGITVAVALAQGSRLLGIGHHGGSTVDGDELHWRLNPHHGDDLLSLFAPGRDLVHDDALIRIHPGYLGLLVLGLAVAGGRSRWWALVGIGVVLAPGLWLHVGGHATGVQNPFVAVASALPLVGLVNHWGRLLLLAQVGLAAVASRGARAVRFSKWAPVLVAVDYLLLSPAPWPLPTADATIPAIDRSLGALPAGAVVVVPSAGPGVAFQRILYRTAVSGRATLVSPDRPGYARVDDVPLVRWFYGLPTHAADPPPPEVDVSLPALRRAGVGVILVEDPYVSDVAAVLGPPTVQAEGGAAWGVPAITPGASRP